MYFSKQLKHSTQILCSVLVATSLILTACGDGKEDSMEGSASASDSKGSDSESDSMPSGSDSEGASETEDISGTDGESMSGSTFDDPGGSDSDSAGSTTDSPTTTTDATTIDTNDTLISTSNQNTTEDPTTEDPTTEEPTTDEPVVCGEIENESECNSFDQCVFVKVVQLNSTGDTVCYEDEANHGCLDFADDCDDNYPAGTTVCSDGTLGNPWFEFSGCTPTGHWDGCTDISNSPPTPC